VRATRRAAAWIGFTLPTLVAYVIQSLSNQLADAAAIRAPHPAHGGSVVSGETDQVAGKAKELQGKVTGDKERESEGKTQQAAGKVEHAVGDAGDKLKGAGEALKDTADGR
jgi:uncharacterized protein YjbJ (UPF0337 family)